MIKVKLGCVVNVNVRVTSARTDWHNIRENILLNLQLTSKDEEILVFWITYLSLGSCMLGLYSKQNNTGSI